MPMIVDPDVYEGLNMLRSFPDFDFNVDTDTPEAVLVRLWKDATQVLERHPMLHGAAEWMHGNAMGLFFRAMREGVVPSGPPPTREVHIDRAYRHQSFIRRGQIRANGPRAKPKGFM